MNKSDSKGFTLMELMIAVVVMGILAAIAYPNYTNFVTQARRSDATINLSRIAALQERFMTQCGTYAANFGAPQSCTAPGTLNAGLTGAATQDGFYTIAIAAGATGTLASSYTLTATPAGVQSTNDLAKCATFTISNTGIKGATGTEAAKCWKK